MSASSLSSLQAICGLDDGPRGALSDDEVAEAYPWPVAGGWVRAMMVTTLDGAAAGPDTLSGSVSSEADQRVFRAVRRFADVVLVGAETLRVEQYTPMLARPSDAQRRAAEGQLPAPVIAVVSRSLQLPWELPVWSESSVRPLILTSAASAHAADGRLARAQEHADVIELDDTTPTQLLEALLARGLRRVVCEGGPRLLRDLVAEGALDEADITLAPLFAGTGTSPHTGVLSPPRAGRLVHLLRGGDDFLMARYVMGEAA
ncbi:pyrimidine reductase family protein [Nocardioides albidus]|uniref:Pyrimidine reductase family protein n=1 Tax=Nocardioides albidus TaxID=1517589 RepID=A0A5C4W9A2_9ACTN|nr:dihydrofolate reductase family protein [Nocardioides albidus]TNM44176.1 pyrimidine reductase family protein [Nocardioides albidus]